MAAIKDLNWLVTYLMLCIDFWLACISSQFIKSKAVFTKLCFRELILEKAQENEINFRPILTALWEEYAYLFQSTLEIDRSGLKYSWLGQ